MVSQQYFEEGKRGGGKMKKEEKIRKLGRRSWMTAVLPDQGEKGHEGRREKGGVGVRA